MSKMSILTVFCVLTLTPPSVSKAHGSELEGFTEPYRTINVAADETGIVEKLLVREGDVVMTGQPLARLDREVQQALLAIAKQSMDSKGRLDSAKAELKLRQQRLQKLEPLRSEGHARQEEVDRARTEVQVAEANVRSIREDLLTRKLEYQKIKVQLERRTIHAPVAGVVTLLHKQVGEFVAPNNPDLLTLVELDPLLANFTVMSPQAETLQTDQEVRIYFPASGLETDGFVELVAPVTDAESGTVRIKLRVANPDGRFRSGERCKIQLPN
jgi:RND family efflux transporter MFP subunit